MLELWKKILFVIAMLIVYRIGTYIPLPGVDALLLTEVIKNNSSGMLGMFNMLTGGALGRLSILTLNIMPYITSSIIMQMMTVLIPSMISLKKEGAIGRRKINQYTRFLAILLALTQGYGIAVGAENITFQGVSIIHDPGLTFRLIAALNLAGGTIFVVWITDQITTRGIGNGTSIVIFCGIAAGLPTALGNVLEMGKSGAMSTGFTLMILLIAISLMVLIVFVEKSQRRLKVVYPKKQVGRKMFGGDSTHLPFKINVSGVIAPIFANSLLLLPTTVLGLVDGNYEVGSWRYHVVNHLSHGKITYMVLYAALIMFFSFVYTFIVFNVDETADNLKKSGAIITGYRPGKNTAQYLEYVLSRITVIGAIYLAFICIVPELLIAKYSIPFYLGGTSLLIVVNVVTDMLQQIQMYIINNKYGNLVKNNMLMNK